MGRRVTAAWPVPSLLRSLSLSGWGELAGGEFRGARGVLSALIGLLPSGSGEGIATAWQIAQAAAYSERHTRRSLHVLEELGVIKWVRGGIRGGRPTPSFFRVVKRRLVEIIRGAKEDYAQRRAEHRRVTGERVGAFAKKKRGCLASSAHADMVTSLSPYQGGRSHHPDMDSPVFTNIELADAKSAARDAARRVESAENVARIADETGLSGIALAREVLKRRVNGRA